MQITLMTAAGTGATGDVIGGKRFHRIVMTTGTGASLGTPFRITCDEEDSYDSDDLVVVFSQGAGYPLSRIIVQGRDSSGYEFLTTEVLQDETTYEFLVIVKAIV